MWTPHWNTCSEKNEAQLPSPLAETAGVGFASSDQLADTSVSAWKASHTSLGGYYAEGPMAILLVSDGRFD